MECSNQCYCYTGDFDQIYPYSHHTPKARQEHICDECGAKIVKGETYHVHKGLCDGDWIRVKNCKQCETIRAEWGCGCVGDLDVIVYECLGVHINRLPDKDNDEE